LGGSHGFRYVSVRKRAEAEAPRLDIPTHSPSISHQKNNIGGVAVRDHAPWFLAKTSASVLTDPD